MIKQPSNTHSRSGIIIAMLLCGVSLCTNVAAPPDVNKHEEGNTQTRRERTRRDFITRSIRGKVVWLNEALTRHYGIKTVAEAAEQMLALETEDGKLHPIAEDSRGRSFRRDKRLRGIDVELLVRQYEGSPMVQIIQVFAFKEDGKYEVDYWCDICAIAMFELKACDCCQGDIELRERKVDQ